MNNASARTHQEREIREETNEGRKARKVPRIEKIEPGNECAAKGLERIRKNLFAFQSVLSFFIRRLSSNMAKER